MTTPAFTEDGTVTLRHSLTGETYHSTKGALTESRHVFIQAGLAAKAVAGASLNILEAGFGTGLNALLSLQYAQQHSCRITYTAIELYPLHQDQVQALNYPAAMGAPELQEYFTHMHEAPFGIAFSCGDQFSIIKYHEDIRSFSTDTLFDLVYYDAFSPSVQPELWTPEIFQRLYQHMNAQGILVTYCAKGQLKRDLRGVGFTVETLPGAPGKREMIRAFR